MQPPAGPLDISIEHTTNAATDEGYSRLLVFFQGKALMFVGSNNS